MFLNKLQLAANFLCLLVIKLGSFKQIHLKKNLLVGPDAQVLSSVLNKALAEVSRNFTLRRTKPKHYWSFSIQIKYGSPKIVAGFQWEMKPRNWNLQRFTALYLQGS